ncbi:hypothetical protein CL617_04080 [archaeon]|nr:hypothetical protein [archaeon]|tara:strand:+ start:1239 stop:2351 length:1113 start_codon:yes stop_codon:yes gene_type:complete
MLLTEKYFPNKTEDIIGQENSIIKLKENVEAKIHSLIFGSNGTGKTSSVYAIANELDLEILELNASDLRNKDKINSIMKNASQQQSLFNTGKIILVDEIDSISGVDRGCVQAIADLLKSSKYPIVITANDLSNSKFSGLKRKCVKIEYENLNHDFIFKLLDKICKNEKVKYDEKILRKISYYNNGDARAAINDLQSLIINKEVLDLELYDREKKQELLNVLRIIFKVKDDKVLYNILNKVEGNFDEFILWLDENLPHEYSGKDLEKAYYYLSKSDIFRNRIMKKQYYRLLVYVNFFLSSGIANSKESKNKEIVKYKRNDRILKIWINNRRNHGKVQLANELKETIHTSKVKILKELNYMQFLFQNDTKNF